MTTTFQGTVRVGVGVWIVRDGCLLLGHRTGPHGTGYWAAPGGHLELGESFEACAAREVEEEVGLALQRIGFYTLSNDLFPESGKHYITIHLRAELDARYDGLALDEVPLVNREPDKHDAWRWVRYGAWPGPLFVPIANVLAAGTPPPEGL